MHLMLMSGKTNNSSSDLWILKEATEEVMRTKKIFLNLNFRNYLSSTYSPSILRRYSLFRISTSSNPSCTKLLPKKNDSVRRDFISIK